MRWDLGVCITQSWFDRRWDRLTGSAIYQRSNGITKSSPQQYKTYVLSKASIRLT
jgi:hypothetical protein